METSVLYRDDNLDRLAALPDESVDLIYLDPPFFSNRTYEVIWGDEAEVRSFEDRWEGGIQHYIRWMRDRVEQMHRVLRPTGSVYLHCDPHASHYLKVMLDAVFGHAMFRNEIIWKRTGSHSAASKFAPVHDVILYYAKGRKPTWNDQRQAYDPDYLNRYYKYDDGDGRLYWRNSLTAAGTRNGSSGQPWRGIDVAATGQHWKFTQARLDELDAEGRIYWPPKGGFPQIKRYRDDLKGVAIGDIWTDIDRLNPKAAERLGYPTQKPEALLDRIISASSNRGDLVLDPFCGCGTTVAVAERLKRQWIGIDISPTAMEIMRRRLWNQARITPLIVGMPDTEESLRKLKPFEFQNWVINALNGTHSPRKSGDMGIDGFWFFTKDPIQVKQSQHPVGRNIIDNFETAMRRGGHDTGYIVAFSFTKDAFDEVARAKADGLNIKLVRVKEVLLQVKRPGNVIAKLGPQPEGDVLPLPAMRKPSELPTAAELVSSDTAESAAG